MILYGEESCHNIQAFSSNKHHNSWLNLASWHFSFLGSRLTSGTPLRNSLHLFVHHASVILAQPFARVHGENELVQLERKAGLGKACVCERNKFSLPPCLRRLLFAGLFFLVNSLSMPAGSAGRFSTPYAACSRKACITSGWIRNGMKSSCPDMKMFL